MKMVKTGINGIGNIDLPKQLRVATHGQGKCLKNGKNPGQGKAGNFIFNKGILEKKWKKKIRKKSENFFFF